MISKDAINKLKDNPSFIEFQDWIAEEVDSINSLDGLNKMNNAEAGEEAKARLLAVQKIIEIFKPVVDFQNKEERSKEDIAAANNKFGLS